MTIKEFKEYVESFGYVETVRNTFEKQYKVRDSLDENKSNIKLIYKVSKGRVFFKVHNLGKNTILKKGALKNIVINANNELEGLKNVAKHRLAEKGII